MRSRLQLKTCLWPRVLRPCSSPLRLRKIYYLCIMVIVIRVHVQAQPHSEWRHPDLQPFVVVVVVVSAFVFEFAFTCDLKT